MISDAQGNTESYQDFVDGLLKEREDNKQDKDFIFWNGLRSYAEYGADDPINYVLTKDELEAVDANTIMNKVHDLVKYPMNISYYGPMDEKLLVAELTSQSIFPDSSLALPKEKKFEQKKITENKVLFVDYDMVQADVLFLSTDVKFDPKLRIPSAMFNQYYGGNMSSVVFQEIRESKGLAYSTFASYSQASDTIKDNEIIAYIGTQPDKIELAANTMLGLLKDLPNAEENFNDSKKSIKKRMRTERYKFSDIFWAYMYAQEMGLKDDGKKELYEAIDNYKLSDVKAFFDKHVKDKPHTMLVIGSKKYVDFDMLKQFGDIEKISMDELFTKY